MLRYAPPIYTVIRIRIRFVFFIFFYFSFFLFFIPSLTMYPTVVSASLRLLSNTYPPYPPSFPPLNVSAPPEGDRPSSIPEYPRERLQLSVYSGYVETLGKGLLEEEPPSFPPSKTAVSTPKEHHFPGYLYATYPPKWTIHQS